MPGRDIRRDGPGKRDVRTAGLRDAGDSPVSLNLEESGVLCSVAEAGVTVAGPVSLSLESSGVLCSLDEAVVTVAAGVVSVNLEESGVLCGLRSLAVYAPGGGGKGGLVPAMHVTGF